jgi:hypothetical protein
MSREHWQNHTDGRDGSNPTKTRYIVRFVGHTRELYRAGIGRGTPPQEAGD